MHIHSGIQSVIDAIHDHIALVDEHGTIKAVNKAWETFGRENGQASSTIGSNYLAVLHNDQDQDLLQSLVRVLEGASEQEMTLYPCHSPEKDRWFRMLIEPVQFNLNEKGAIIIHQNKTTEIQAKGKLRAVLESMTDAFFSIDDQWRFVYVNAEAETLLEQRREHLIGHNLWEVFPEAVQEIFYEQYYAAMEKRVISRFEAYHQPLDTWFDVVAYPNEEGGLSVYFHNINERKEAEKKLQLYAYRDDLTGLPNRRELFRKIDEHIDSEKTFAVLFIDLNGFKQINDMHGHDKGDDLLIRVGGRLKQMVDSSCWVGRLGGDEFLILTGESSKKEINTLLEQLTAAFAKPFHLDDHTSFSISASIGISWYPMNGTNATELVSMADTAMYEAKKHRETTTVFYHPDMHQKIERKLTLEKDLSGDLREAGLSFVLQPQMNMETNQMTGAEVLSRWNHPVYGFIEPGEFIAVAEESGHMLKLSSFMFCELFIEMKKWISSYQFQPHISFNVTPSLVASESFFDDLFDLIDRFSIPPEDIELEITEAMEFTASLAVIQNLSSCRDKGIQISIDDFGTGYSTFSYLKDFPVDKMKIDKYFIDEIGVNEQTEAILKSMIQLAKNLGYSVVAEGVETKEQVQFLMDNGCSVIQGFYIDRPLSISTFEEKYVRGE